MRRMIPQQVATFLRRLADTGSTTSAAGAAGVTTSAVYAKRKASADFAAAWEAAMQDHTDTCEAELTRRAFGYEEPVVYQGQLTPVWERDADGEVVQQAFEATNAKGEAEIHRRPVQARHPDGSLQWLTIRKFSDTLLLAKVKAYNKRYSTERTELTGADGGDLTVVDSTQRAARVAAIMARAKARKADADDEAAGSAYA